MDRLNIFTAPKRNSKTWKAGTVSWDEICSWLINPSDRKEAGNYVLGSFRGQHRGNSSIISRSGITLDVDHPAPGFFEKFELLWPYAAAIHTTYSSAPDAPRYRLIIPLDRDVLPDEYVCIAREIMRTFGAEQFDPTGDQPARYMFRPAAQDPSWYRYRVLEGAPLPADEMLSSFEEDLSDKPLPKPSSRKRDPFTLDGVVGAFNRAYEDVQLVIDSYSLPYEPDDSERWHLVGARSVAGMGQIAPGLFFSHHAGDPAGGRACSAFDLVRLHRFGDLDEGQSPQTPVNRLPSHTAMVELATQDPRVLAEIVGADFDEELDEVVGDQSWKTQLALSNRGKFLDVMSNWDLVRKHNPVFAGLYFNELSLAVETDRDLPWRSLEMAGPVFSSADRAELAHALEREFGIRPARSFIDELVNTTAHSRWVNPVREYLAGLTWDGSPRLEESLPGVRPTPYTRLVARKALVAAVARMFDPGVKWDHTLVLYGTEGLGKSYWVDRMSKGYSASLGRIGDKDTLITMQRSWIMISDEGHSLRKADADVQKEFLTRTEDVFRMPYERESIVHKRHCVIWGTTNDEIFLRRQEGNRRFLIVRCEDRVDFEALTDEYVDQVWAEAVHLYRSGELLFLGDVESLLAEQHREEFIEEDALAGVVHEFLEQLVPEEWDEMPPDARREWMTNRDNKLVPPGTRPVDSVCSAQIWVEALGKRLGDHRRTDLLEVTNVLKRMPGWHPMPSRHRIPFYGPQLVYVRERPEDLL